MPRALEDKVVLVTGGAGGLGRAIVKACSDNKAKVVICDVNEERVKETENDFEKLWHVGPLDKLSTAVTDVSNETGAAAAVEHCIRRFGRLDVLINCAGIMDAYDPVDAVDVDLWNRVLAVNLTGPALMSKHAVKHFLARNEKDRSGCNIINIASAAAVRGAAAGMSSIGPVLAATAGVAGLDLSSSKHHDPETVAHMLLIKGAAYTASKHGLIGLTKNTAAAYARKGIRCNAILPGNMETNLMSSVPADFNEEGQQTTASLMTVLPGSVDVEKLAKTVVHLASDNAEGVNGAVIAADNGWTSF
ncbi:Short-chain dehydrogenase/reductase SDR [Macrophomina phaseolina MS6]|uniref:Short-chain dehydrogenase/reductase SDR n=1 Tax=Macrophomina phaseolina (strain MS6) TaxID=1126212 RepID=K2RU29_MACPH|nr:Short-chain dehydrogenase/reductase SDR [Macrophomina phaseolina MS6]